MDFTPLQRRDQEIVNAIDMLDLTKQELLNPQKR
jgi:hypothetical protein